MRKTGKRGGADGTGGRKPYRQRCAVRVTYLNNRTRGQWKAHGRYLARESATSGKNTEVGFNRDRSDIDIARELDRWQSSDDPRIWKVIISPEFGDRVDLQRLTREIADRMAKDLGTDLEWAAVAHHNTEHAHVHMVMRGVRSDGQPLQMRPAYLKHGIREVAEDLCTGQIGYRTGHDAAEAERREIGEHRFTSLDRAILRAMERDTLAPGSSGFAVVKNPAEPRVLARLAVLQRMGLAESTGLNTWNVRGNLAEVLRSMQRAADRQKTLAAHGVAISDNRLPIEVLDLNAFASAEGRILVHGQDEQTGRSYLMLEGTDAKVHYVEYTPEMELLRADGALRVNNYLRLRRMFANGRSVVQVQDLGDSEKVLDNRALLRENARALLKRGIIPTEDGWGGWLGRYQAALASVAREHKEQQLARSRRRGKDLSCGR
jgi:type IV secretory pathway VirD2 relaxase